MNFKALVILLSTLSFASIASTLQGHIDETRAITKNAITI